MTLEDFVYTHYKKWWMRAFRGPLNLLRRKGRKWRILIGNALGLPVPDDFTMKLEWIKYFDKNPLMVACADKVKVKEYVANLIGDEYIIKTLGVYDNADEIDFSKLPNKCVIKTNNASGTNIIIKDKSICDISAIKEQLNKWIQDKSFGKKEGEWQYLAITPKILVEEFIECDKDDLNDYKFFCMNGVARYVQCDLDRHSKKKSRAIYDINWNRIPLILFTRNYKGDLEKPENYEKMVTLAEQLSKPFKQVRVDFYNVNGKIYFGEMTFFSGDLLFRPRKWNKIWGRKIKL